MSVLHEGISNSSRVFEGSIANTLVNHVYNRTFHGQSGDFFMSSINVVAQTGKMLGPKFIGQVKIGVRKICCTTCQTHAATQHKRLCQDTRALDGVSGDLRRRLTTGDGRLPIKRPHAADAGKPQA